MLYLAQVTNNPYLNGLELQLLVMETNEHLWQNTSGTLYIENRETLQKFNEGVLVLVEIDENKQVLQINSATNWILGIIKEFLSEPTLTTEFIQQEEARIEQARQEITSKKLDLTRRQLEIETQREQIQAVESSLSKS
ncbi:MAG: hypothetical protein VKL41_14430 [Snowella sp.]|jgi:hypothetical protein|nr:hypothetical protein [Snowella sp.]PZV26890.1 MAG: hypothetical protein DCF12_07310 [Snowella sp.]